MKNKILIVDDSNFNRELLHDILSVDYEILMAEDGIIAKQIIEEKQSEIKVILLDLMMPRMNGKDCIKEARAKGIKVPIVAFTAIDDPEVHQEALDAGANLVLTKPCKPNKLLSAITDLLDT